mmetsp:Transcript_14402/g.28801  ORF Transcript_14402/g.28801 Transcript_14402/m.28801 type:complete len:162 (+) Transcript_14402:95-580(+)|eukprot:CAMPEP_0194329720 /NCGR_PEP_ID=MMETSP0171-20130528/49176_1 /TAXON_ID=218684 /ORGANISM="Corethron pennatum, Strain L29A3" /LENGTH=161 /DNA_ID=CAMNT_0039090529 /DNA_START=40 /DNA_END=525 /DNA_ORIENTATION=-
MSSLQRATCAPRYPPFRGAAGTAVDKAGAFESSFALCLDMLDTSKPPSSGTGAPSASATLLAEKARASTALAPLGSNIPQCLDVNEVGTIGVAPSDPLADVVVKMHAGQGRDGSLAGSRRAMARPTGSVIGRGNGPRKKSTGSGRKRTFSGPKRKGRRSKF